MPEVLNTYTDAQGRKVTVYADAPVRRERQLIRKGTTRTAGRKTRTPERAGLGSWKGCK